ncbi:MAG: hypothetical protein KF884_05730 [Fimbriimonadaceae bacterium]|nr:hypothetical protein [Fimbriimonadaceae bacterium]QYK59585.1 MAG: hypothetical protein KF884_05730 [Fimbriimonadaceae bacterium]
MSHLFRFLMLGALPAFVGASSAQTFRVVPTERDPERQTWSVAINNAGHVLLERSGAAWAWRWHPDEGLLKVDNLGDSAIYVEAMNEQGTVLTNQFAGVPRDVYTVVWTPQTGSRAVEGLRFRNRYSYDINGQNEIAARVNVAGEQGDFACVYDLKTDTWRIGKPPGTNNVIDVRGGISDQGSIAVFPNPTQTSYVWKSDGRWVPIVRPPRSLGTQPKAINGLDTVVGHANMPAAQAFIWDEARGSRLVSPPSARDTVFLGINDLGQCVGTNTGAVDALYWREGMSAMVKLRDRLHPDSVGWDPIDAADINEKGQIAATARFQGGPIIGVVLDPVTKQQTTDSVRTETGRVLAGGLSDLHEDDGKTLRLGRSINRNAFLPPVSVVFQSETSFEALNLWIKFKARVTKGSAGARAEFWNFESGRWDSELGATWTLGEAWTKPELVALRGPIRYFGPDGAARARVTFTRLAQGAEVEFDLVRWEVVEKD